MGKPNKSFSFSWVKLFFEQVLSEIVNIIFTGQLKPINIKVCFLRTPKQSPYYLVMVPQLSNLKNTIIKDELVQHIKGMGGDTWW
jgi:hypothetical protein